MSKLRFNASTYGSTPASGKADEWFDSTARRMASIDDAGRSTVSGGMTNAAIAAQGAGFASDTYVTGSDLLIPSFGLQVKTTMYWIISLSKTAAGVATPVYTIRLGSARTTADTAILAITGPAQTAAADVARMEILATLRSVGASGVLQGTVGMAHNLAATGFATNAAGLVEATSAGFDTTSRGGQYFGLSINAGASAAWTITQMQAFLGL